MRRTRHLATLSRDTRPAGRLAGTYVFRTLVALFAIGTIAKHINYSLLAIPAEPTKCLVERTVGALSAFRAKCFVLVCGPEYLATDAGLFSGFGCQPSSSLCSRTRDLGNSWRTVATACQCSASVSIPSVGGMSIATTNSPANSGRCSIGSSATSTSLASPKPQ